MQDLQCESIGLRNARGFFIVILNSKAPWRMCRSTAGALSYSGLGEAAARLQGQALTWEVDFCAKGVDSHAAIRLHITRLLLVRYVAAVSVGFDGWRRVNKRPDFEFSVEVLPVRVQPERLR